MAKVAKLVYYSFVVRVLVDENATDGEIVDASKPKLQEVINNDLHENLEDIVDDEEMPFGDSPNDSNE